MNLFIILTISVFLAALYPDVAKRSNEVQYLADIEIEKLKTGAAIRGMFLNNSDEQVRFVYRLSMHKKGEAGRSSSNQGGFFIAEPGEKVSLSQISITLKDGDTYSINLKIFYGQELVAEKFIRSSFDISLNEM
ncbi:MAG: curli-like amyloid fiber formation chaperone CsgH [Balneolales bacterium]